jgi:hypothetical protein
MLAHILLLDQFSRHICRSEAHSSTPAKQEAAAGGGGGVWGTEKKKNAGELAGGQAGARVSAAAAKEGKEEGKEERKARMREEREERVWQERVWQERIERNGRKAKELSEALSSTCEMECLAAPERVWASMPIRHYLNTALT